MALEDAVRADVAALGVLSGLQGSLAETAFILARSLDRGAKGMGAAALARELRVTLEELVTAHDRGDAAGELISILSAPVRDGEVGSGKSRRTRQQGGAAVGAGSDAVAAGGTRRSARG